MFEEKGTPQQEGETPAYLDKKDEDSKNYVGGECLECGAINKGDYEEGELVTCLECGTELEYTSKGFQLAPAEEEDWGE